MKSLIKHPVTLWAFGLMLIAVPSAHAENVDPFQASAGIWKSFDRYKEEQKNKAFSESTGDLDADAKAAAARDATEGQSESDAEPRIIGDIASDKKPEGGETPAAQVSNEKTALASPERPLVLPSMPALTARFNLTVDTTADDQKPIARVAHIDTDPDFQLPKQNWLNAAQAAQLHAEGKDRADENVPINVRLTFLPSFKAPVPQHKAAPVVAVAKAAPMAPEPVVDHAACAAIDAYKKRELEAIQSDRNTLTALQAAIADLGLKKQLNFVAGQDSKMDTPEDGGMSKSASP